MPILPANFGYEGSEVARTSLNDLDPMRTCRWWTFGFDSDPEKQDNVLLLRRDDRYFTAGRPATAVGVGLFKHFGCPKPLAL